MTDTPTALNPSQRVLMGPGPSDVAPSVSRALSLPTLGHLDPEFLVIMDEIRAMLRTVLGTENPCTIPMSGTGSAGMETCLVNLIEPGDAVLVGINGVFGTRMAEVAKRCGAEVTAVEKEWGRALQPDDFRDVARGGRFKLLCVVHAETSTGARTDVGPLREVADELGALLVVDAVTSVGGIPFRMDAWGIDAMYTGTQKCLSCPPGLAPVSFSSAAMDALQARSRPVQSWYLDLSLIGKYWGSERTYHHTAPINMLYGLHEALRLVLDEGLEARHERHARVGRELASGLEEMGLSLLVPEDERLPQLTSILIPEGVSDADVRGRLLAEYGVEIGGGLGPLKGRVWRVGLMGASATTRHVTLFLSAIRALLRTGA